MKDNILETATSFFKANPQYVGIGFATFGVFMLFAAIKNWEWVFQGRSYNTKKLEGISNMYGRGCARIVAGVGGVFCIVFGIFWFVVYAFYYQ